MNTKKTLYIFIITAFLFFSCSNNEKQNLVELYGTTMGTTYSVKLVGDNSSPQFDSDNLKKRIDSVLVEVNRQMSTYIPTSEISEFNSSLSTDWFSISKDFAYVVDQSIEIGKLTNNCLDITIGPVVNIWGFGPDQRPKTIPSDEEISKTKKLVGIDNIELDLASSSIRKKVERLKIDLSATAKGFGVDKVFNYLKDLGFKNIMVEIGGEVRTSGLNHKNEKWKIGISEADHSGGINKVVELSNLSMATSGDYWNYFEEDGIRYSHTIDPTTGKPITHKLASVTVFDSTCVRADGLATALFVMGTEKGYQFAVDMELAVYQIVKKDTGFEVVKSPKFIELFEK